MRASGEIGFEDAAPTLKDLVNRIFDEEPVHLIFDFQEVSFVDAMTLGVMVGTLRRAREHGRTVALVLEDPTMKKIFEITGLERAFLMTDSVTDAERTLSHAE